MQSMRRLGLCALFSLCFLVLFLGMRGAPAHAAEPAAVQAEEAGKALDGLRQTLQKVQGRLQKPDDLTDTELVELRNSLTEAQEQAQEIGVRLEPELSSVEARLTQLGPVDEQAGESEDIARQRAQLQQAQSNLDGQIKLARLIGVETRQGIDQISKQRRQIFQAELGRRSQSILTPRFWSNVKRDLPGDLGRVERMVGDLEKRMVDAPARVFWLAGALALLVLGVAVLLARGLADFTINHTKPSRLRRSFYAAALIVLYTLAPGLLGSIASMLLHWQGELPAELDSFVSKCVFALYLGGFVTGMGRVLLAPQRPSWRLPPIPGDVATKLAWLPIALGVMVTLTWMSQQLLGLINATLSATLLVNSFNTLTLSMLIAFAAWNLTQGLRVRQPAQATEEGAKPEPAPRANGWFRSVPMVLGVVIAVGLLAFLLGYIALSSLIVQETLWLSMVICTCYVLVALVGDIGNSLLLQFKEKRAANELSNSQLRARSQLVILLSGAARLSLIVAAVTLVLLPFGEDPAEWLQRRLGFLMTGFSIGQVQIKPGSVLAALLVLLVGIFAVKVLQRWMTNQLLPATRIDAGMRVSTANLFSYVGYFVVLAMTISSLGIGLERMAWIISALSVGIGFGLQAVVQNFVSGLILLAERPIKVGDWVSLNGVEGNVRKINARATEIEMFDRSTLIVPNSEFITKPVRNVTLTNPLGVVNVKINMPIDTDAKRVRDIMMEAMQDHPDVLEDPAPGVTLDGFDANGLAFTASSFVSSPRLSAKTRSSLMFEILDRLRRNGLVLHHTQTMTVLPATPAASQAGKDGTLPLAADTQ